MADDDHEGTLGGAFDAQADIATGMGQLVAARKVLTDGGFAPDEAFAIVIEALRAATR